MTQQNFEELVSRQFRSHQNGWIHLPGLNGNNSVLGLRRARNHAVLRVQAPLVRNSVNECLNEVLQKDTVVFPHGFIDSIAAFLDVL